MTWWLIERFCYGLMSAINVHVTAKLAVEAHADGHGRPPVRRRVRVMALVHAAAASQRHRRALQMIAYHHPHL